MYCFRFLDLSNDFQKQNTAASNSDIFIFLIASCLSNVRQYTSGGSSADGQSEVSGQSNRKDKTAESKNV